MNSRAQPSEIPSLTGLRGLAALGVVHAHLSESLHIKGSHFLGEFCVMIFFCLSGFLMGYLYLHKTPSPREIRIYAAARVARIAPAYLSVIVVAFFVTKEYPDFIYAITDANLLRHLLFSGNVSVLWSIPPEVQFYVLFPLVWAALESIRTRKRLWIAVLAAIIVAILFFLRTSSPGTFVASKIQYFAAGVLLGFWKHQSSLEGPRGKLLIAISEVIVVIGIFLFCVGVINFGVTLRKDLWLMMTPVLIAAAVVGISANGILLNRLFENKVFKLMGSLSFSVYLIHMPVLYFVERSGLSPVFTYLLTMLLGALALPYLCHRYIEKPVGGWLRSSISGTPPASRIVHELAPEKRAP